MAGSAVWLLLVLAVAVSSALYIEIPDELIEQSRSSSFQGVLPREKRQVKVTGGGSDKAGTINFQGTTKNLYSDEKTSVAGTLTAGSTWQPGQRTSNTGSLSVDAHRNLFDDGKTKVDLSGFAQRSVATGSKPYDSGSLRLDAQRSLFQNENTRVNANGFAQRNVGTGMSPHDSFGAGLEVSKTLARGRDGSLDVFAGYQRQWHTPSTNNFNTGIRWNF